VKRCRHDIIADILEFVASSGRARLSYIARYSNLPMDRAKRMAEALVAINFLEKIEYKRRVFYRVKKEGYVYLAHYREIRRLLASLPES